MFWLENISIVIWKTWSFAQFIFSILFINKIQLLIYDKLRNNGYFSSKVHLFRFIRAPIPQKLSRAFHCGKYIYVLEGGLLSRTEPLCEAYAPFIKDWFPNTLYVAKSNLCFCIFVCPNFTGNMYWHIGRNT